MLNTPKYCDKHRLSADSILIRNDVCACDLRYRHRITNVPKWRVIFNMRLFYATCVKVVVEMLSLTVSQSAGWMFISLEEFLCLFTVLLVSVASLVD